VIEICVSVVAHVAFASNRLAFTLTSLTILKTISHPEGVDTLQADVIPTCRELGIGIVAYSPLGRGFLTGTVRSIKDLHESDWRVVRMPRFQGENLEKVGVS